MFPRKSVFVILLLSGLFQAACGSIPASPVVTADPTDPARLADPTFTSVSPAASNPTETAAPTAIPTPIPLGPADYQGWWKYTNVDYQFSILLPKDWIVDQIASNDPGMSTHSLNLHPDDAQTAENIRLSFGRIGEDIQLWPTGVGQGQFVPLGDLEVAGLPAQRLLLVCPTGEVTAIWYHQAEGQPNILRGALEFGIIFSAGSHCEPGRSLSGKIQYVGEMIIASLTVP